MLDDNGNIESSEMFSSIDAPDMSNGIPDYNEDDNNNKTFDLDRFQSERDELNKSLAKQQPPQ